MNPKASDRLFGEHANGTVTDGELFVRLLELAHVEDLNEIEQSMQPGLGAKFAAWLGDVAGGAEVATGQGPVLLPASARAAISVWVARRARPMTAVRDAIRTSQSSTGASRAA